MDGRSGMSITWKTSSSRSSRCSSGRGGGRRGGTGILAWQACGQLQRMRSRLEFELKLEPFILQLNLS